MNLKKAWLITAILIGLMTTTAIVSADGLRVDRIDWRNPHYYGYNEIAVIITNEDYATVSGMATLKFYIPQSQSLGNDPVAFASRAAPRAPTAPPNTIPYVLGQAPYSLNGKGQMQLRIPFNYPFGAPRGAIACQLLLGGYEFWGTITIQ
jgi:hypothetical protein